MKGCELAALEPLSIRAANLLYASAPNGESWSPDTWKEHVITLGERMLLRIPGLGRTTAQEILEWATAGRGAKFEIEIDVTGYYLRGTCQFPGFEKKAGFVVPLGDFLTKYALELNPAVADNFVASLRSAADLAERRVGE